MKNMLKIFICSPYRDDDVEAALMNSLLEKVPEASIWLDDVTEGHLEHQESVRKLIDASRQSHGVILICAPTFLRNATGAVEKRLSTNCEEFHEDHNLLKAFFIPTWDTANKTRTRKTIILPITNETNVLDADRFTYFVLIRTTLVDLINRRNRYGKNEYLNKAFIIQQTENRREDSINLDYIEYTWIAESTFYWERVCSEFIKLNQLRSIASQLGLLSLVFSYALKINFIVSWRILKDKGGQAMP